MQSSQKYFLPRTFKFEDFYCIYHQKFTSELHALHYNEEVLFKICGTAVRKEAQVYSKTTLEGGGRLV